MRVAETTQISLLAAEANMESQRDASRAFPKKLKSVQRNLDVKVSLNNLPPPPPQIPDKFKSWLNCFWHMRNL